MSPQSTLRLADVLRKMGRDVFVIYREELGHFTTYKETRAIIEHVIAGAQALTEKK